MPPETIFAGVDPDQERHALLFEQGEAEGSAAETRQALAAGLDAALTDERTPPTVLDLLRDAIALTM